MGIEIKHFSVDDKINISGTIFNGLQDILDSVELSARVIPYSSGDRDIVKKTPKKPKENLHVLELYMPYPVFDFEDSLNENRQYSNFFFSDIPFTDEDVVKLAKLHLSPNYCLVNENTDKNILPAVFYQGDPYYGLKVAYSTI